MAVIIKKRIMTELINANGSRMMTDATCRNERVVVVSESGVVKEDMRELLMKALIQTHTRIYPCM